MYNYNLIQKFKDLENGKYKKDFQFFETPSDLVKILMGLLDPQKNDLVFEPSAGRGAIVDEVLKYTKNIEMNEIEEINNNILYDKYPTLTNYGTDFLKLAPADMYSKIIMNPPFSKGQDVEHFLHAWRFLAPGGTLVSVMSDSCLYKTTRSYQKFQGLLGCNESLAIQVHQGAFKESGTLVGSRIIKVKKPSRN